MNPEQTTIIEQCAHGALTGELAFPDIIQRLSSIGVERYHADYSRHEITYYFQAGESFVVATPHGHHDIGQEFSSADVASAVRQSQLNEHTYLDFIEKTMKAGCVGYFVQLTGRCVIYFGRKGESHTEHFPGNR
ncbi:MAG: DUF1398 family protein [Zavarzinella sp.]